MLTFIGRKTGIWMVSEGCKTWLSIWTEQSGSLFVQRPRLCQELGISKILVPESRRFCIGWSAIKLGSNAHQRTRWTCWYSQGWTTPQSRSWSGIIVFRLTLLKCHISSVWHYVWTLNIKLVQKWNENFFILPNSSYKKPNTKQRYFKSDTFSCSTMIAIKRLTTIVCHYPRKFVFVSSPEKGELYNRYLLS